MKLLRWWNQLFPRRLNVEQRFEMLHKRVVGGTSTVYLVKERSTQQRYALKLLEAAKVAAFRHRFQGLRLPTEGEIGLTLDHPNIVRTREAGVTTTGQPFVLMEWWDGPTLDYVIEKNRLDLATRLAYSAQMIVAVAVFHGAGWAHRDICPRNFLTDKSGSKVLLFDFGISLPAQPSFFERANRQTTPLYMAPEVIRRRGVDVRSDLFSLAATLYHLLSGHHPWGITESSAQVAMQFDTRPPEPLGALVPELNPKIVQAIERALAPQPDARLSLRHLASPFPGAELPKEDKD